MPLLSGIAALLAVLALVVLVGRFARFTGFAPRARPGGRQLVIEETVALDSRRRVHLIRCGDRKVLLLTGGTPDLVAGWLPDRETPS